MPPQEQLNMKPKIFLKKSLRRVMKSLGILMTFMTTIVAASSTSLLAQTTAPTPTARAGAAFRPSESW